MKTGTAQIPMRFALSDDPALEAATLALSGRAKRHASQFASIELRAQRSPFSRIAPLGYLLSGVLAISLVLVLWFL